ALIRARHLWTLLLLLISHLLLWENVTSVPMCAMRNGRCFVSLKDMFDIAGSLSHEISKEVSGMFTEFEKTYGAVHRLRDTAHTSCHTSSLPIPENKGQAMNTHPEVLLKLTHSLLQAWVNPLHHLWVEMGDKLGYTPYHLTKALEIKTINRKLLKTMKTMTQMRGAFIESVK
ncbi:prolactin family 2, subfamily c, member 1 isoform X1, partial [Sigmodon hispidus]